MKAVIFAGGMGTRLWPLSRKSSPKQFEQIVNNKSTLQLSIELLAPEIKPEDIYIATGVEYLDLVTEQLPEIPKENIIGEPHRKDVGPAVCFWMGYLSKKFPNEPLIILWSDFLIKKKAKFKQILKAADALLTKDPNKIVYLGHKPRFASENLGWIETGEIETKEEGIEFRTFKGFRYRPDKELAQKYYSNDNYSWNVGTFSSTAQFMYDLFKQFAPETYELTEKILSRVGQPDFEENFSTVYEKMPKIHLDNAISEQIDPKLATVIVEDFGWSDVGAWEALKEALEKTHVDNVIQGKVLLEDTEDSLVYNYDTDKLIVGIDLEDFLVVNTHDVLLVTKKTSVPKIKKLVESMAGTEHEDLT